jgi:hypothetical protein
MAYKKTRQKRYQATGSPGLRTEQQLAQDNTAQEFFELETGEVVDVIRSEDHEDFQGFEDIGKVKFRFVESQTNKPEDQLFYAKPFNGNVQKYPLRHEMVLVGRFVGNYYYLGVVNYRLNQNHNELPFVSIDPDLQKGSSSQSQNYQEASTGLGNSRGSNSDVVLGETFEPTNDFKPLVHDEGDVIVEGRFSNSLRFGSNAETGKPIVRLRCGQPEEASDLEDLERIREDINKDPASITMGEDKTFGLAPSTEDSDVHFSSIEDPPNEFSGKQVITVSDRIVMDAKNGGRIMQFASGDINLTTRSNFTFDVEKNVVSNVLGNRTHLTEGNVERSIEGNLTASIEGAVEKEVGEDVFNSISDKIVWEVPEMYFGEEDQSEPIVLGQTLVDILTDLLNALQQETHPTPVGPSGPPINSSQYAQIQQRLQQALSERNFTK